MAKISWEEAEKNALRTGSIGSGEGWSESPRAVEGEAGVGSRDRGSGSSASGGGLGSGMTVLEEQESCWSLGGRGDASAKGTGGGGK